MSNRYGGVNRILRARNMIDVTAGVTMPAPGTDLTVTAGNFIRQLLTLKSGLFNVNTNFNLKKVGAFCNFADGLVFANMPTRLDIVIDAEPCRRRTALTGTDVTLTNANTALAGTATSFSTELATGDVVRITDASGNNPRYYQIASVTNNTTAVLTDYSKVGHTTTIGGGRVTKLELDTAARARITVEDISELNELFDIETFFNPANYYNQSVTLNGTGQLTAGSTALAGAGGSLFLSELTAGDRITIGSTTVTIASVTNDTTAVLTANSPANAGPAAITRLANTSSVIQDVVLFAQINEASADGIDSHSVVFHTDSVGAGFTGDDVLIDVVAEVEFTE